MSLQLPAATLRQKQKEEEKKKGLIKLTSQKQNVFIQHDEMTESQEVGKPAQTEAETGSSCRVVS